MDLWIRSQDKMALSKYDLLILERTQNDEYMFIADHYYNMGVFKSKDRALEVLNEIQDFIENNANNIGTENFVYYIYQIPQE